MVDHLTTLRLIDADGGIKATIENKPGTQGSFRVYHFVASHADGFGPEAAKQALALFAEHVQDAKQHPGKHPNIDRLFEIIDQGLYYTVDVV